MGSGDGFERGGAELAQAVEAAAGELAGDRHRGPGVRQPARLEFEVVAVVGASGLAGRLRRLVERPAQLRRSLSGQLPQPRVLVGAVHADVEAGAADRLARRRQARHVAELGDDAGRGDRPDAVVAHQLAAARLAAGKLADVALERGELAVERVDHFQCHLDPLAGGVGQLELGEERAAAGAQQLIRHAADAG